MNTPIESKTHPMAQIMQPTVLEKIKKWYRNLPDKKRYLEFITALLTIPVLLTVLWSNLNNLQQKGAVPTPTSAVQPTATPTNAVTPYIIVTATPSVASPTATPNPQCNSSIPPVTIATPQEGDIVSGNPVCLAITGQGGNYCSVVWSYRLNGGAWSNYTSDSICMYGLSPGNETLDLRVQSVVTGNQTMLTRHFTVAGSSSPTPTPATSSATLQ